MWRGGEAGITERGLTSAVSAASPRLQPPVSSETGSEDIQSQTFTSQLVGELSR